jgi:hypothetical protein
MTTTGKNRIMIYGPKIPPGVLAIADEVIE